MVMVATMVTGPPGPFNPTGGVNNSVLVAKRPIAPAAPASCVVATEWIMGVYMINIDDRELTTLYFRRSTDEPPSNVLQTQANETHSAGQEEVSTTDRTT
jgi:hypothetical protein